MARLFLISLLLFTFASVAGAGAATISYDHSAAPTVSWGAVVGANDAEADQIDGIAIDRNGNTAISGVFREHLRIGSRGFVSRGEGDIFLASFAPDGTVRWTRQIGAEGDDNTFDLRADGKGNMVASGWFSGRVDFGGTTLESAGSVDMFLAKFNGSGELLWAQRFGGPQGDGGNELDVLDNGEIAVAGISEGPFTAGGVTYPFGGGGRDSYLLRVGSGGALRWVRPYNGPGTERIRAVAMNPAGKVFPGFEFRGSVSNGDKTVTGAGDWDGALAALDADGGPLWIRGAGGPGVDNVRGTAVGPDGSVYASGQFTGDVPVLGANLTDEGAGDDFLMRLSAGGAPLWTVTTGGPGAGVGGEIRSWDKGVAVSSLLNGDQRIHGPGETLPLDLVGNQTGYLVALGADGKAKFAYLPEPVGPLGGTAPGGALAVSPDGLDLAVSLRVRGQISLDGQTTLDSPTGDSAVIRLALPRDPRPARVRIIKASPRRFALGPRNRLRKVRVRIRNQGESKARKVRVCFRGNCWKRGSLGPGKARTLTLRIRARMFHGKGMRRPRIRLKSGNAGRDSIRLRVRLN